MIVASHAWTRPLWVAVAAVACGCGGLAAGAASSDDRTDLFEDDEVWESRVMDLAAARIAAARARLEGLGIIDAEGRLVSTDLPTDMLPDAHTSLETA